MLRRLQQHSVAFSLSCSGKSQHIGICCIASSKWPELKPNYNNKIAYTHHGVATRTPNSNSRRSSSIFNFVNRSWNGTYTGGITLRLLQYICNTEFSIQLPEPAETECTASAARYGLWGEERGDGGENKIKRSVNIFRCDRMERLVATLLFY